MNTKIYASKLLLDFTAGDLCKNSYGTFTVRARSHLTMMCFFCRHVWTVTLVTMQPISDDIEKYADNIKTLCRCRQVRTDP